MGALTSLAFDFTYRQKLGGTNNSFFFVRQAPVLSPRQVPSMTPFDRGRSLEQWLSARVLELAYTASDLVSFARDLDIQVAPFRWDSERRFLLRCELDAAFFHFYLGAPEEWRAKGTPDLLAGYASPRDAVAYILDTFPILRRKDEEAYGEYRTKRVILEIYDEMQRAHTTDQVYRCRLNPPPGDARVAHPTSERQRALRGR